MGHGWRTIPSTCGLSSQGLFERQARAEIIQLVHEKPDPSGVIGLLDGRAEAALDLLNLNTHLADVCGNRDVGGFEHRAKTRKGTFQVRHAGCESAQKGRRVYSDQVS